CRNRRELGEMRRHCVHHGLPKAVRKNRIAEARHLATQTAARGLARRRTHCLRKFGRAVKTLREQQSRRSVASALVEEAQKGRIRERTRCEGGVGEIGGALRAPGLNEELDSPPQSILN